MKKFVTVVIAVVLIGLGSYVFLQSRPSPSVTPTPTPIPSPTTAVQNTPTTAQTTPSKNVFCTPSQLQANMESEGAAGNIYVTLKLKNVGKTTCQVTGNNIVKVDYPISVTNFKAVTKRQPTTPVFILTPNQTIYSLIHFPNGPQCSSPTTGVDTEVSYAISPKNTISFKPITGTTLQIPSCSKASEITTIDVYPFSMQQVTP